MSADEQDESADAAAALDTEATKAKEAEEAAEAWSLLSESLEPRSPDPAVRARLLALLEGAERFAPFAAEVASTFGLPVADAREALRRVRGTEGWVPGLWPGSQIFFTPTLMRANTVISRLAPGTRIPRHLHATRELTYVLDGVLLEDDAIRHLSGTFLDMPAGSEHDVSVPADADCLVVFSVARR